jgi:hypothetical protein
MRAGDAARATLEGVRNPRCAANLGSQAGRSVPLVRGGGAHRQLVGVHYSGAP